MTWKPHVTVAAVIEQHGRFLMVEEIIRGRRVLNQPAGHLEPGESLIDAVIRETLEETAWHFMPESLVGIYRLPEDRHGRTFLRFCFTGSCQHLEDERELDEGIERTVWLDRSAVLSGRIPPRSPMVLRSIDDYLSGQRYPLSLLQEL